MRSLLLRAGTSRSGKAVYEDVLADEREPGAFNVLRSPGLVLGIAAGDTIRVTETGDFEVMKRGGNLCIQIFRAQGIDELEEHASRVTASIGARLDGQSHKELVYTIPVVAGFAAVERAMQRIVERFPDVEWYYGNVYDPADGVTPLNWWT